MSQRDDKNAIGILGRQEILTWIMVITFGGFAVIVSIVLFLVLSNPEIANTIKVTGSVDIGKFVDQFQMLIPALLALLGVGIGVKLKK